jgi:hypothetical protein
VSKTRYGVNEIWDVIDQELDIDEYAERNLTTVIHRWIGEKHIYETGRNQGSGNRIVYTEKDIRRAIAYLRIQRLIGTVTGKVGSVVTRRLREVASYHREGWAVATLDIDGESQVFHQSSMSEMSVMLSWGKSVIVIPCEVSALEQEET